MGFWSRVSAWFGGLVKSPRDIYVPSPGPFRRLDIDALRSQLKPTIRGEMSGRENLPTPEASAPDRWEREILETCEIELKRAAQRVTQGIDTLVKSIVQVRSDASVSRIRQHQARGLSEIRAAAQRCRNGLGLARQRAEEARRALQRFREAHRRTELPVYRDDKMWRYAILVGMIVVESAINGNMFAFGSAAGLVGGISQAFVFAFANVGLGAVMGRLALPQAYHIALPRRTVGLTVSLFVLILALALNLGVAHFRDASVQGSEPGVAAVAALSHLRQQSLQLHDLQSWLLLGLGCLFFLVATIDTLGMDDPYPGYGARYREWVGAKEHYEVLRAQAHRVLAEAKERHVRAIDEIVKQAEIYAHAVTGLTDRIDRLVQDYESHTKAINDAYRVLIDEYRESNRRSRSTPSPEFFTETPRLALRPAPPYTVPTANDDLTVVAAVAVAELSSAHDAALDDVAALLDEDGGQ